MGLRIPGSITSNFNDDDKLLSFFTRFNYNIGEKYLFTATLRADGSSKFSADKKWDSSPLSQRHGVWGKKNLSRN